VALAVADALALTVMEAKGVTPEGFAANHPSGQLGRRLTLRVRDVMLAGDQRPTVSASATLLDVVGAIGRGGAGVVLVVDEADHLLGIVTDGDVRRAIEEAPDRVMDLCVTDVMTREPTTVDPDAMAYDALRLMEDRPSQISVLPVVEQERCAGVVRLHDLVRIGL
jgi:arabinose-5-phosphate isomerase